MDLMNCKLAIVYTSITGNTREVARMIHQASKLYFDYVDMYHVSRFPWTRLGEYDAIIIGTYTWGNGEIPKEMIAAYNAFESVNHKNLVTGVFGTGDSFYPHFCGAVEEFKDMLYVHTTLAAILKIELLPQDADMERCYKFVRSIANRLNTRAKVNETDRKTYV